MSEPKSAEEKRAIEAAHNFIDWMAHTHGFVPYGFHRDLKAFYLNALEWKEKDLKRPPPSVGGKDEG